MKRNKAIAKKMRSGVAPYTRAKREDNPKRPYRYSEALRAWERSVGRSEAAIRQSQANAAGDNDN